MKVIAFYIAHFDFRGTGNAVYNYAHYNEVILENKSIILYKIPSLFPQFDNKDVYDMFRHRFSVYFFDTKDTLKNICDELNVSYIYFLCSGEDISPPILEYFPKNIKTIGHQVFKTNSTNAFDVSASISETVSKDTNIPYVYHIVDLPFNTNNMRKDLNIPEDAIVFGRIGGYETFDIQYVIEAILEVLKEENNIYFVFAPRPYYFNINHPRVKYLDIIVDLNKKREFINTCDAMIHARKDGETFGISVLEFIYCNKPVFTTLGKDNQHIINLRNNAIIYRNKEELIQQITTFNKSHYDIKLLEEFTPLNVMQKFKKIFLD
jgi:glycosyltransferase involved in cell wall biosynthesis